MKIDPCCLNVETVKLNRIQSSLPHIEYDPARQTLRDSPRRGYADESIVIELEKMTLATVDGAFELEIDSLFRDATRTALVLIDLLVSYK